MAERLLDNRRRSDGFLAEREMPGPVFEKIESLQGKNEGIISVATSCLECLECLGCLGARRGFNEMRLVR